MDLPHYPLGYQHALSSFEGDLEELYRSARALERFYEAQADPNPALESVRELRRMLEPDRYDALRA